jgi:three-Cys-motif partner protein
MATSSRKANLPVKQEYWDEYTNLQDVKQKLIRSYLQGWFPKLGLWAKKVIYFDTHAGRGKYSTGESGSPLTALETLLSHSYRDKLLAQSEVHFYFVEQDEDNLKTLNSLIEKLDIPKNVHIRSACADCFDLMNDIVTDLKTRKAKMAPAFVFVDPFGFKMPGELLKSLLEFEGVEVFLNLMWRELDMAMRGNHGAAMESTLSSIFCGDDWKQKVNSEQFDERADQAVNLLREKFGVKWGTYIRMLGDNSATRYLLVHFTNHDDGRELIKDSIWKVCPDGGFYARKSDSHRQYILITPDPDLKPLELWVMERLAERNYSWTELLEQLRAEIWRGPHLTKVLTSLRKAQKISTVGEFKGRFGPSANPLLQLIVKSEI